MGRAGANDGGGVSRRRIDSLERRRQATFIPDVGNEGDLWTRGRDVHPWLFTAPGSQDVLPPGLDRDPRAVSAPIDRNVDVLRRRARQAAHTGDARRFSRRFRDRADRMTTRNYPIG